MRDGRSVFRRAVEASVLLHLLLLFVIVPQVQRLWPVTPAVAASLGSAPNPEQKPLEFELVDLPQERKEKPDPARPAPLSDMDRKAHGGEGDPALIPGSHGNSPELVQSPGGQAVRRPQPQQKPQPQVPPAEQKQEQEKQEQQERQEQAEAREPKPEGAGEQLTQPQQKPQLKLPPVSAFTMPEEFGGVAQNPSRKGGRVDMGALSFDTQWYDWGPYAKQMLAKIKRNWYDVMPEIALLGVQGVVKIRYFIERDGTVTGLSILDESGRPPMDFAARDGILNSSPFEPLPTDLTGVDREGVTITFYYNMHPPDWNGEE